MAIIQSSEDLKKLKYSCLILMSAFHHVSKHIKAGVACGVINDFADKFIRSYGAIPSFLNVDDSGSKPYKYAVCISINDEVAHGIAPMDKIIPDNCILTLDMGANYQGLFSDSAMTYIVGEVDERTKKLVEVAKEAMWKGINKVKAGAKLGDIGFAIDSYVQKEGFGNVRVLGGHGVGYSVHEEPFVAHQGMPGKGQRLFENQVICIEPMITNGGHDVFFDDSNDDGWTVRTKDKSWVAQFEHEVLVTKKGFEVLTEFDEKELLPIKD
jgi:methionyl aminopeptidase